MEATVVKAYFQRADSSVEVRRIPIRMEGKGKNFNALKEKVANVFPDLQNNCFTLMWKDSDNDMILMSTDEEMQEALSQAKGSPLKVYIFVNNGEKSMMSEEAKEGEESTDEPTMDENHKGQDPFEAGWPVMGPMGVPFFLPPEHPFRHREHRAHGVPTPPPFGPPMEFHHRKQGHPGPQSIPMRGHGPRRSCGHRGGTGPSEGPGPFGGRRARGRHGPFEGRGHFGEPFPLSGPHFFHGGPAHHHQGPMESPCGERGWKANLRDAVPVAHRRWAKGYIRNWRVQNLKNATTTSSDNEKEEVTMASASVPEAYAKFLDMLLPRWHKRWGKEGLQEAKDTDDSDKEDDITKEERKKLMASVPMEFVKWTRWYLNRHFGRRDAPKFHAHRGHGFHQQNQTSGPCLVMKMRMGGKCGKKEGKGVCKMRAMAANVPGKYRRWAKAFINEWRHEHKLSSDTGAPSSESEDTEKEVPQGEITIPNDYARWMRKFLQRWHIWRGQIDKQTVELEKGGMGEFKDTVPKEFLMWVKMYMCRKFDKKVNVAEEDNAQKYKKWLMAFQQKWLREQQEEDSDGLNLISTDDEAFGGPSDKDQEMESSLKKQHLENQSKNLRFETATTETVSSHAQRMMAMADSDDEGQGPHQKKVMSPEFRKFAKEALYQWDGKTTPMYKVRSSQQNPGENQSGAVGDEVETEIPPRVYNWMSKMMMKTQMKQMKQEMKDAKKEMKAAKEAKNI